MFILFERTPNPDALKFLPHARLTDGGGWSFRREDPEPRGSALADLLFELDDVARVHIGEDFVTVTRHAAGAPWDSLRGLVVAAIAEHLASGAPAVLPTRSDPAVSDDDVEAEIRQVIAIHVRPGAARDGGDIVLERFDAGSGVVWIRMEGACGGCPSSRLTLKAGVERILRRYVPEVSSVEEHVDEEPASTTQRRPSWLAAVSRPGGAGRRVSFNHNGRSYRSEDGSAD